MIRLDEIAAIGGTEQDLEYLEVSDSESIIAIDNTSDTSEIRQELQGFVDGLGLQQFDVEDEDEPLEQEDLPKISSKQTLLFEPAKKWYLAERQELSLPKSKKLKPGKLDEIAPLATVVKVIYEQASVYWQEEQQRFLKLKNSSDAAFLSQIVKKGTSQDRVSAMALSVQESPLHYLNFLDQLLKNLSSDNNTVVNGKRREVERVVDVLHELFRDCLCPTDSKLKFFGEQSAIRKLADYVRATLSKFEAKKLDISGLQKLVKQFNPEQVKQLQQCLIINYVEDQIKTKYYSFIMQLHQLSNVSSSTQAASGGGNIAQRSLNHLYNLLVTVPEQESTLLTMLVSKFGINNRVLASKTVHLLGCLLDEHPGMKMVVVKEVEGLLNAAQGKSLSQLAQKDKKSQQIEQDKLHDKQQRGQYNALVFLSQIVLTTADQDVRVARHLISIYMQKFGELVNSIEGHSEKPKPTKQKKHPDTQEESIEAKMMSAVLAGVRRAMPYALRLIDGEEAHGETAVTKHVDQMFKLVHSKKVAVMTSVQALQILLQMLYRSTSDDQVDDSNAVLMPKLTDRFYRALYSTLHEDRHDGTHKHYAIYLNVIYKSMQNDQNIIQVLAFIRRLLQVCHTGVFAKDNAFVCAVLVVIGEVVKSRPEVAMALQKSISGTVVAIDSDDEEVYVDRDELDQPVDQVQAQVKFKSKSGYDAMSRSPQFCMSDMLPLYELLPFVNHYHPTVKLFASVLISGQPINYPSDPLQDFTLIRFLDRFVFKNPKTDTQTQKKLGVHQGQSSVLHTRLQADRSTSAPVNTRQLGEQVPADEQFYKTYFDVVGIKEHAEPADSDAESLDDQDVFEAIQNEASRDELPSEDDDEVPEFSDVSEFSSYEEEDEDQESSGAEESEDEEDVFGSTLPVQSKKRQITVVDKAIKKLKTAFASVDDYQQLIDKDPDWLSSAK